MGKPTIVTLLGSTGSIGRQTLQVIQQHPDRFQVHALTARRSSELLYQQCLLFKPRYAALVEESAAGELKLQLQKAGSSTEVIRADAASLCELAGDTQADVVVSALVGAQGMAPTMAAARAGRCILLANKESLVVAGQLLMDAVRDSGATLLPVDSEHNAIFQALPDTFLPGQPLPETVKSIILTASGGPFRKLPLAELATVSVEQALAHPNWSMGQKVSIDSATMMNKALEVIEAHWLFAVPPAAIEVVVHPQSIVHSMVRYLDGSVLAQLGVPDMRTPIAHCLAWPARIETQVPALDFLMANKLEFEPVCAKRFPSLQLAYDCLRQGGAAACVLNAANEVAVQAFLDKKIAYSEIYPLVYEVLSHVSMVTIKNLDDLFYQDKQARLFASHHLNS